MLKPRNVVLTLLIVAAFIAAAELLMTSWQVLTWMMVAAFIAVALHPAVKWVERIVHGHSLACMIVFSFVIIVVGAITALVLPTVITQMHSLVKAAPNLLNELSHGHGRLGFLERRFHLAERLKTAINVSHTAAPALAFAKSVVAKVAALVTVAFLTLFMLLEGEIWIERGYTLLPQRLQSRWRRAGDDIARMIVGYALGNLLISLIAALVTLVTLWLARVPFALPLAVLVALLDLVPIAGAFVAGVIVTAVAFTVGTPTGLVVLAVFVCYHQVEGHILQPLIYGKTVRLSPLIVLVAILLGVSLDGILGAIAAIPVAAIVQIIVHEVLALRRQSRIATSGEDLPDSA